VLEPDLCAFDLSCLSIAPQLPGQLRALREAGGSERVALRDQTAGRVDHRAGTAEGRRLGIDELVPLALSGEAERLVGDQLIGARLSRNCCC